jgi:hypothetical protein
MKSYLTMIVLLMVGTAFRGPGANLMNARAEFIPERAALADNAATQNNDTSKLVKTIIANKQQYVHKEMGVLLDDLRIPPGSYAVINHRYDQLDGIELAFEDQKKTIRRKNDDDASKRPVTIQIIWETPMPAATYRAFLQMDTTHAWGAAQRAFYAKQIVKDIY